MRVRVFKVTTKFTDYGKEKKMGKIGVFWIVNSKVDGFKEPVENGEDYGDTIQPSFDHYTFWSKFITRYPILKLKEYDEVPRGRVVYDKKKKRFMILSSEEVLKNKKLVESICLFYDLDKSNIETKQDEHYEKDVTIEY